MDKKNIFQMFLCKTSAKSMAFVLTNAESKTHPKVTKNDEKIVPYKVIQLSSYTCNKYQSEILRFESISF